MDSSAQLNKEEYLQQALRQAQKQNEFLADLVRTSSQPIATAYADGRVGTANHAFEQLTGYSAEELCSIDWATVLTPSQWREVDSERLSEVHRTGKPVRYEKEFLRRDGTRVPVELLVDEAVGPDGVRQYRMFVTDLTDRKTSGMGLSKSEAKLRAVFQALSEGVVFLNKDGVVEEVNNAATRIDRHTFTTLAHPELDPRFGIVRADGSPCPLQELPAMVTLRTGEPVYNMELGVQAVSGGLKWINANSQPVHDATGQLIGAVTSFFDISERKQTEEALRQSIERLEKVLDVQTVGVMFWDLNTGCMIDANESFLKLMGYSRSDVDSRELTWEKLTPPEYFDVSMAEVKKFLATGRVGPYEKEYFCKDGTRRWLLFAGSSLGNNQCVEFCVDVSERKKVEQGLRESEERFRSVMQNMSAGLMLFDTGGNVTFQNSASLRLHGFEPNAEDQRIERDLLKATWKGWSDKGQPLSSEEWPISRVLREERFQNQVLHVKRVATDHEFDASYNGSPLYDSAGNMVGGFVTLRNITDELRAGRALRESEAQFRTLANAIPQLCWIANADGWIFWYNDRWYQYTGTTPQQMEGWGWQSVHDSKSLPNVMERWKASIATGEPFDMVFPLRGADGVLRPFLTRVLPVKDAEGKVLRWFGTNTDISEQKKTEKALRESEQRYRELSRELEVRVRQRTAELHAANKELEAFSYSVSHDLRAPLRTLDGFSQALLRSATTLDDKGRHYLERIQVAADKMRSLIDGLLQLSRLARTNLEMMPVDLSEVAASVLDQLRSEEPHRNVELRIQPRLQATGDSRLLHAALQNLLSNAWKFTSKRDSAVIEFGQMQDGPNPVFFVKDNGAGFDMEHAERLFAPFQRLHAESDFEGTGIGLATVQRIVHRHNGRIWAESAPGEGTTFYFELGTNEQTRKNL